MEILMHSKWGVELEGHGEDIENLSIKLNNIVSSNGDYFVCRLDNLYVLRTRRWDLATEPMQVSAVAQSDFDMLRSCLDVVDGCGRLMVGTVFEFNTDDAVINQTRDTTIQVRVRKSTSKRASPEEFRSVLNACQNDSDIRDAMEELKSQSSWFDIYKSIEALESKFGGESDLLSEFSAQKNEIKATKRTANSVRHVEGKFSPVKSPVEIEQAKTLVKKLILDTCSAISQSKFTPSSGEVGPFQIQSQYSVDGQAFGLNRLMPYGTKLTFSEDAPEGTVINEVDP